MYDDGFNLSSKCKSATKCFIEAAINTYENKNKIDKPNTSRSYNEEAEMLIEASARKSGNLAKYHSFVESVKSGLVLECMYSMLENSLQSDKKNPTNTSILRAMCSQYIRENGYDNILSRMKNGSVALSEMYNIITKQSSKILESAVKDDPNTFVVTPEMKDEFYKELDYSDSDAISDAIKSRVSDAMDDFVTKNAKEYETIEDTLKQAQDKIDKAGGDVDQAVKESYNIQAKRKVSNIRNAPKNVFHAMVSSMCESVLKDQTTYAEFMNEGQLDVSKVVDRVSLMYTFMEMLNTSKLEKIDTVFVENAIKDLKS